MNKKLGTTLYRYPSMVSREYYVSDQAFEDYGLTDYEYDFPLV